MMPFWLGLAAVALVVYGVQRFWKRPEDNEGEDVAGTTSDDEDVAEGEDYETAGATEVDTVYDFRLIDTYPPHSAEAVALFQEAAARVGLPVEWASWPSLHNVLAKESKGRVGVPNYTYLPRSADPANWPAIWEDLRAGKYTGNKIASGPQAGKFSSATGLGQLTLPNVRRYYPDGVAGIGDAVNEAAGMMKYIQERYGDPDNAWALYGKRGEGY